MAFVIRPSFETDAIGLATLEEAYYKTQMNTVSVESSIELLQQLGDGNSLFTGMYCMLGQFYIPLYHLSAEL